MGQLELGLALLPRRVTPVQVCRFQVLILGKYAYEEAVWLSSCLWSEMNSVLELKNNDPSVHLTAASDNHGVADRLGEANNIVNRASVLFVLLNEGSGSDDKERTKASIARVFDEAGQRYEFICVSDPTKLIESAQQVAERVKKDGGALIVAGGDGTISCVATVALEAQCPFGVIPMGTFNYFARANHISEDPAEAAAALLSAATRPAQVGQLNDAIFLVNASLGLYPDLLEEREQFKRRFGRSRFVAFGAALVTLFREHRQLALELVHDDDHEYIRTPTLVVANNRLQLEQIGVNERPVERGKLVAIVLKPAGPVMLCYLMLCAALGRLGKKSEVQTRAVQTLIVRPGRRYGTRRLKVAMDGEIRFMSAPLVFRVADKALQLLVAAPEPAQESLK